MKALYSLKTLVACAVVMMSMNATTAHAEQQALDNLNNNYGTNLSSCSLCHTSAPALSVFGQAFKAAGGSKNAYSPDFVALSAGDADGDGTTNGAEILAGTDPNSSATTIGTTGPSASVGGCMTSGFTAPLMMLGALLGLALFARRKV
ncbi:MAG: hypothetical protein AUK35_06650 [Zetaproteobacteria bacterium CG2_30_46_52]|nr:MAG: hypothetical protein AUK35_06650 [Zetaproteobacteria bacterium CG2_30_46_52]